MNVFDYIQDYVNRSNTGLYGDFLQSNEEDAKIEQLLSGDELLIYRQYKMADRNRIAANPIEANKAYNKVIPPNYYKQVHSNSFQTNCKHKSKNDYQMLYYDPRAPIYSFP